MTLGEGARKDVGAKSVASAGRREGTFTLTVDKTIDASGTIATPTTPLRATVRVLPVTRLFSTAAAQTGQAVVRADLDNGAVVRVAGTMRAKGGPVVTARAIQLQTTASEALGPNLLPAKNWLHYIVPSTAEGTFETDMARSRGVLRASLTQTNGTDWSVQMGQIIPIKAETAYTLRFRARADVPRLVMIDSRRVAATPYVNEGLSQTLPLDTDWRAWRIVFTAKETQSGAIVPDFLIGARTGSVWFADLTLVEGAHPAPPIDYPAPRVGTNLLLDAGETNCWALKPLEPAAAKLSQEDGALKVVITALDAEKHDYAVPLYQIIDLEPGRKYHLHFTARADATREIVVQTGLDNGDYRLAGLDEKVSIGTQWKPFDLDFTAKNPAPGHTRAPFFAFGDSVGTVWLANVTLAPSE